MKEKTGGTADPAEIERFSRLAEEWWNPDGKLRPLHRMNPVRIRYILDRVQDSGFGIQGKESAVPNPESRILSPLRILDIGCGGGLVCEPLARLGARVTGIDASEKNIAVAKLHAQASGLEIDYSCMTAEALAQGIGEPGDRGSREATSPDPLAPRSAAPYDLVLALEIIEHVADVPAFVTACAALVRPGGLLFVSTLNRTAKAWAMAILGAEYVLRLLPAGTHDWRKFLRPSEVCAQLRAHGIAVLEMTGMAMQPLSGQWRLTPDTGVNYIITGRKE